MATVTQVKAGGTSFRATVEGGPQLAAALRELEDKVRAKASKEALAAGGRVYADEWADRVPVGEPPDDPHPGAYRRAMEDPKAVKTSKTKRGASASVAPALLGELPDDDQPRVYAARLEWGDADRVPQPSARAAFDAVSAQAVDAIADELRKAIAQVAR